VIASRLKTTLFRTPQLMAEFVPGDPMAGYYNDLRAKAADHGTPRHAVAAIGELTTDRGLANAVPVAQLGLGAWQLARREPDWLRAVDAAATWLAGNLDEKGRFVYLFPMPHTFPLEPPWSSAMAQGETASLLVRAAAALERPELAAAARRAVEPLIDESLGLVSVTPEGPVLQEYPTEPPAHVLNGWIFALWGLYDAAVGLGSSSAAEAFDAGAATLERRLPLYDAWPHWSRYDLFPHRIAQVASPFYHRLHIEQVRAMAGLRPEHAAYAAVANRWERGIGSPVAIGSGVARKVAFRLLVPRTRQARA
jgi:hypothetical protein